MVSMMSSSKTWPRLLLGDHGIFPPGQVSEECFPRGTSSRGLTHARRVSFASDVTVLGGAPPMDKSPDILLHDPICPEINEENEMNIVSATTDAPMPVVRPPPGFGSSHGHERSGGQMLTRLCLTGWCPWVYGGQPVDPPSLPVSPILQSSLNDSVIANEGSSREESNTRRYRHTDCRGRSSGRNGFQCPSGFAVAQCCQTVLGVADGTCC